MLKAIIIGLVVTVVGIFSLAVVHKKVTDANQGGVNGYPTAEVADDAEEKNSLKVQISGEVNHPGDYYVEATDTLKTLIDKAGGVTEKADRKAYNENTLIDTHTSFYIAPVSAKPSTCVEQTLVKVNVNTAGESELKGVDFTASQASNLITYRIDNGAFQAIEEILEVKGIGASTFAKVKNRITIS